MCFLQLSKIKPQWYIRQTNKIIDFQVLILTIFYESRSFSTGKLKTKCASFKKEMQ